MTAGQTTVISSRSANKNVQGRTTCDRIRVRCIDWLGLFSFDQGLWASLLKLFLPSRPEFDELIQDFLGVAAIEGHSDVADANSFEILHHFLFWRIRIQHVHNWCRIAVVLVPICIQPVPFHSPTNQSSFFISARWPDAGVWANSAPEKIHDEIPRRAIERMFFMMVCGY